MLRGLVEGYLVEDGGVVESGHARGYQLVGVEVVLDDDILVGSIGVEVSAVVEQTP